MRRWEQDSLDSVVVEGEEDLNTMVITPGESTGSISCTSPSCDCKMSFGDAFCQECGVSLAGAAKGAKAAADAAAAAAKTKQGAGAGAAPVETQRADKGRLAKLAKAARRGVQNMEQLMPPTFVRR
jgi:hypothetical protein